MLSLLEFSLSCPQPETSGRPGTPVCVSLPSIRAPVTELGCLGKSSHASVSYRFDLHTRALSIPSPDVKEDASTPCAVLVSRANRLFTVFALTSTHGILSSPRPLWSAHRMSAASDTLPSLGDPHFCSHLLGLPLTQSWFS